MSMDEVFADVLTMKRDAVLIETWGHLAPRAGWHRGKVLFTHGEYGDIVPLRVDIDDVDDSPWFFQGLCTFLCEAPTIGTVRVTVGE